MVDTGIVQKLLELLDRHVEEGNVTVQHAALSALRNLAIPGEPQHQSDLGELEHTHQVLCHLEVFKGLLVYTNSNTSFYNATECLFWAHFCILILKCI